MNKDPSPTDCCDFGNCNQGRNCPVRGTLHTKDGGAFIDTHTTLDLALERVDRVIVGVRFVLLALSAACLVMLVSYFYG